MSLSLSIPHTSESHPPGARAHTLYHIALQLPLRTTTVYKRYNDFVSLQNTLTSSCSSPPPAPLPPKSYLKSTVGNPAYTETRRRALESYLNAILNSPDPRWREAKEWKEFLGLPASFTSSPQPSGPQTPGVLDPQAWLDQHRELKSLLHNARIALSKREQATTPNVLHEASAQSKRCLVKAGGLIKALDEALTPQSVRDAGLLEGEVRRRKDLVAVAKKEKDGLDTLSATLSVKRTTAPSTASATSADESKARLLAGHRPHGSIGGGRVLGAPLPETDKTRELDNNGVLQLQKDILKEQDQGVERLIGIVRKQKAMGIAIGEELEIQNQMLEQLGDDVDRVDRKTKVAGRRVDRIR